MEPFGRVHINTQAILIKSTCSRGSLPYSQNNQMHLEDHMDIGRQKRPQSFGPVP